MSNMSSVRSACMLFFHRLLQGSDSQPLLTIMLFKT